MAVLAVVSHASVSRIGVPEEFIGCKRIVIGCEGDLVRIV